DNKVFFDPTGKASGRGTYICPKIECLNLAIKKKAFSYALKCEISNEILTTLKESLTKEITQRGEMKQ
ncbi:MAG: YlxR family protein, partial [Dictyoglomus sp.]